MRAVKTAVSAVVAAPALAAAGGAAGARVTYDNTIKSIMDQRCLACHGPDAPTLDEFNTDKDGYKKKSKGPRMDTHENLLVLVNGSDAGALMRRLDDGTNTKDGKPGNMYANLGSTDAERAQNSSGSRPGSGAGR